MSEGKPKLTKAAALNYDGENTPTLVAKGTGAQAEEIIALAEQHQVHIHNDPLLIEVLSRLELEEEIPNELYLAVAKIIAFAYYLQCKHPQSDLHEATSASAIQHEPPENKQAIDIKK